MTPPKWHFREQWAKSTDTPLRFFVHMLFIIEGVLGTVLIFGFKYNFDKNILLMIIYAVVALAIFTLILVFVLVAFFPKNLVFDKEAHLLEKALSYGDEGHVLKYFELSQIEQTSPTSSTTAIPSNLENQQGEG